MKSTHLKVHCEENPYIFKKSVFAGDPRFHCVFHMDFYNSVNLANNKKNPIVHQKWIDWIKYHTLSDLTLDAVLDHLENGDMMPIVNFLYNLSDELIAQFFATHWIESSDACHH